jgi:hypothetical protein
LARKEFKDRYATIYFNTADELARWEAKAKNEYGSSLSSLAREALNRLEDKAEARPDLIRQVSDLKEENLRLQSDLKLKSELLRRYEADIFRLQNIAFATPDPADGSRRYPRELVALLQDGKVHSSQEIFDVVGIDPQDLEASRLLQNQLLGLQRHGLLAETVKGWKWLG